MSKCKSLNFESQREILKNYVVSLKKCVGAIFSSKPQIITKSLCVWLPPGILKRGDSFIFYYRHIFTEVKLFASHKSLVASHELLANTSHQFLVNNVSSQNNISQGYSREMFAGNQRGRREVSRALFGKLEKSAIIWGRKCPDFGHLWVKFLI